MATARDLRETRRQLGEQATLRERLRIDDDLRTTVEPELQAIVERAAVAGSVAGEAAVTELRLLVDQSRGALTAARKLIRGYQHASVVSEVRTASNLLAAAGIEMTTHVTDEAAGLAIDDATRARLRTAIANVLSAPGMTGCDMTVDSSGGRIDITVAHHTSPTTLGEAAR